MNALQTKLGVAALLVGAIIGSANLPSQAYDGCNGWYHPRRAEVLHRDAVLGNEINRDYGNLNGNYGRLANEDRAIRQQAQREAFFNGGRLSYGEQRQLNREENNLQRQINYSHNNWF